jgi:hypothetical protein
MGRGWEAGWRKEVEVEEEEQEQEEQEEQEQETRGGGLLARLLNK